MGTEFPKSRRNIEFPKPDSWGVGVIGRYTNPRPQHRVRVSNVARWAAKARPSRIAQFGSPAQNPVKD